MQCFKVKDTNTGRDGNYVLSKCSKSNVHVFIRQSFACFQIIFAVNHIIYASICTHSFYSWLYLWQYLCATLYIPVRSAKVSCVSLPIPVPLFICLPLLVCPFTFTEKPDCDNITFTTKYTMCFLRLKFNLGKNIADDFGLLLYLLCVSFSVPRCIFETDVSQWCCVTYTCVYWDLDFQLLGELLKEGGEKKTQGGT